MRYLWVCLMFLFNLGLTISLTFGGIILVRPITNHVLRPRQRAFLWYFGWYAMCAFLAFGVLGRIPLHVTFRAFLSARTSARIESIPAPLPDYYDGPGQYNLALPGNTVVPVTLTDGLMSAVILVWAVGIAAVLGWSRSQKRKLRALERAGEEVSLAQLDVDDPGLKTIFDECVMPKIYLCEGLPTSYVRMGLWGNEYFIYLQRELSPRRLALVLRHELEHIRLRHVMYKSWAHVFLIIYWWSPLMWLAFRLLCRDMELDCDEAVMDGLDGDGRREYVRIIAELGAGRPLWESAATFGECDAAIRVRRAANWKKTRDWEKMVSWAALVLLLAFFYCGGPAGGGALAADQGLDWKYELSQDVTELPVATNKDGALVAVYQGSIRQYLFLTDIWTDPDSTNVYGLDTQGGWWRFNLDYVPKRRQHYAVETLPLSGAPDLSGMERVK